MAAAPVDSRFLVGAIGAGFLTALSLLLPWFELSGRRRSSIDLIGSASALDVIEGVEKALVIGAWMVIPVVVATSMLIAASGRHRPASILLVPVGPIVGVCVVLIVTRASDSLACGLWVSLVCASAATALAIAALRRTP